MASPARALFTALAAVALLWAAAASEPPRVPSDEGSSPAVAGTTALRTSLVERVAGPGMTGPVGAAAIVVVALMLVLRTRPLIGPRRRRIGDDGDDWRSLLLGAPPAPA